MAKAKTAAEKTATETTAATEHATATAAPPSDETVDKASLVITQAGEQSNQGGPVKADEPADLDSKVSSEVDPRVNTTAKQNQIDWNDPRPDKGAETVAVALEKQADAK